MEDKIDTARSRILIIVARDRPDLRRYLTQDIGGLEVILDRRLGERRRWPQAHPEKRRRFDRRFDSSGESNLHRHGFAIVHRQAGGPMPDWTK